jgi:hypothetical protein
MGRVQEHEGDKIWLKKKWATIGPSWPLEGSRHRDPPDHGSLVDQNPTRINFYLNKMQSTLRDHGRLEFLLRHECKLQTQYIGSPQLHRKGVGAWRWINVIKKKVSYHWLQLTTGGVSAPRPPPLGLTGWSKPYQNHSVLKKIQSTPHDHGGPEQPLGHECMLQMQHICSPQLHGEGEGACRWINVINKKVSYHWPQLSPRGVSAPRSPLPGLIGWSEPH